MGLIKASNASASAAAPFSMKDIEDQAKAILLRARQQAEKLIAAAQAQGDQIKAAAHDQGFAAGKAEGLKKGIEEGRKAGHDKALGEHRESLTQLMAALGTVATDIDTMRGELESAALREVAELAIAIGRRVTKRQGMIDADVLCANIVEAMKLVVHVADVRIVVHPSQKATLEDSLPRLKMQWPNLAHVAIVEDATLAVGGCRICTAHGEINADLDAQLDRIVEDMLPARDTKATGDQTA